MFEKVQTKYKTVPTFNWMLLVYKPGRRCQLTKLFKIMDSGEFPEACGESILCLIFKKGNVNDPVNHKIISLIDVINNVFTGIVTNDRIYKY